MRSLRFTLGMVIAGLALTGVASAQEPVRNLQDLIGARGSDGEYQMKQRGYNYVRTEKSGGSAYSYWRESRSSRCVTVRTADGRYRSIVYAPDFDCQGGGSHSGGGNWGDSGGGSHERGVTLHRDLNFTGLS